MELRNCLRTKCRQVTFLPFLMLLPVLQANAESTIILAYYTDLTETLSVLVMCITMHTCVMLRNVLCITSSLSRGLNAVLKARKKKSLNVMNAPL